MQSTLLHGVPTPHLSGWNIPSWRSFLISFLLEIRTNWCWSLCRWVFFAASSHFYCVALCTSSALWHVHFIMPGFVPFGTGESEPSGSLRSREQRTTTRTRDAGNNKNMKRASLEERQQRDGKSGYCSGEMSAGCICGNLSMRSQPEMRGREVERNQRFNWEPRRSKQSSATGNQSAMANWSNRRAGRQWWEQAEVSNTTPATHKELWAATQWPEASYAWRATSSRQLLTANEGGNASHWNISGGKTNFCYGCQRSFQLKWGCIWLLSVWDS